MLEEVLEYHVCRVGKRVLVAIVEVCEVLKEAISRLNCYNCYTGMNSRS